MPKSMTSEEIAQMVGLPVAFINYQEAARLALEAAGVPLPDTWDEAEAAYLNLPL